MAVAHLADRLEVAVRRRDDPFVPVTVSRKTAATVCGPSYWRISSRCGAPVQTGHGSGWPAGQRYVYGSNMRTTPGIAGLVRPAARVAGQGDSAVRRAVVRAIPRDDLVAPRVETRELDRVLVRLGARVREERHGEVAGRHLGEHAPEPRARLVRHRRPDRAELVRLLLDRRDDLRVLVPDVEIHELRGEVEVALAVVVPEVAPFRAGNRDRVDRVLHRPGVEDELLRVRDDLRPEVRVRLDDRHYSLLRSLARDPSVA